MSEEEYAFEVMAKIQKEIERMIYIVAIVSGFLFSVIICLFVFFIYLFISSSDFISMSAIFKEFITDMKDNIPLIGIYEDAILQNISILNFLFSLVTSFSLVLLFRRLSQFREENDLTFKNIGIWFLK